MPNLDAGHSIIPYRKTAGTPKTSKSGEPSSIARQMDPFSTVARLIAVLNALTTSNNGTNKLLSLRKEPGEMLALSNEVEALRAVLLFVDRILLQVHESTVHQKYEEALKLLLKVVEASVLDLERNIDYQLKHPERVNQDGRLNVSHANLLEIEPMRDLIKYARRNLVAGLSAVGPEIRQVPLLRHFQRAKS